ncbi:hypothetical protein K488DRAFT_41719 [Vararia minispora EC-137]|uniref:Uncharacterized protein n=1 Tax=Vararia minispora EC-137 TaxID=1314806 RepID=A0ACB8QWZ3_9AGAM|nr:hypothetical protein K488DRAFT_41719 [Vararia minispora EC-137]
MPTSNKAYRTKPCRFFLAGNCQKGDTCTYIHEQKPRIPSARTLLDASECRLTTSPKLASSRAVLASGTPIPAPQAQSGQEESSQGLSSSHIPPTPVSKPHLKRGEIPCHAWKAGHCIKGEKCWLARGRAVLAARDRVERVAHERVTREAQEREIRAARERAVREAQERAAREAQERAEREAQERAEREAQERAEQQARQLAERLRREREEHEAEERRVAQERLQEEERARRAAQAEEDAMKTIQSIVFGSIVTFEAGLSIPGVITGFECCSIRIRNLPPNATEREITSLFTQQGIDPSRFLLHGVKRTSDTKQATVIMDAESGHALSIGLDEIEFRDQRLAFEVGSYNLPGKMGQSTTRDPNVLTISWRVPSARYVVTYSNTETAETMIRELNGTTHFGRRLKVEKNSSPPGRTVSIDPNSVKIDNLPPTVLDPDICALAQSARVRRLPTKGMVFEVAQSSRMLRDELAVHIGQSSILSFERAPDTGHGSCVNFCVRFASWEDAKKAHDFLETSRPTYIGSPCWFKLPAPLVFNMTIVNEQFNAQHELWDSLRSSLQDKGACNLAVSADLKRPVHHIRLLGSDKQAVGAMRVRVESLAAGEKIEGWHASLAPQSNTLARTLLEQTGAYIRTDWKQRQIRVYGNPRAVERARTWVARELAQLAGFEKTTVLPPNAVRFFMAQGLAELKELLGDDNVKYTPRTRILSVSGGEEAHHAVTRLLQQAVRTRVILANADDAQLPCPICFDDVTVPFQLGCGHMYCASCLRHYLSSACENDTFPIVCIGDEGHCEKPIPIPTIEHFLPPSVFTRLLEVAFSTHIAKRPHELRYCKTADCAQIYRVATVPTALQCPSCMSAVCAACHGECHDGMSCAEYRMHRDPAEQERALEEWIQQQGGNVKKCPRCSRILEKNGGCNHMSCACGAHVCWRCLGVFPREEIYGHMNTAHGGIYDEDVDRARPAVIGGEQVNIQEQQELYVQARRIAAFAERARLLDEQQHERARLQVLDEQRRERVRRLLEQGRQEELRRRQEAERVRLHWEDVQRQRDLAEQTRRQNQNQSWCTIM